MAVAASVQDGQRAVETLKRNPAAIDVIILDSEMPVMDGMTALPLLIAAKKDVKVVMASTQTLENAEISMKALALGAVDYVPKPTSTCEIGGASDFKRELVDKICAVMGRIAAPRGATTAVPPMPAEKRSLYKAPVTLKSVSGPKRRPQVVAIGSSTGGPQALLDVIGKIGPGVREPILITQHMPASFTTILAKHLGTASGRPSAEARDGEPIAAGHIYGAPGDYHMVVETRGATKVLRLNQNPPENFCRPAVDPMFRSIAAAYGDRVLAVILTGMESDGAKAAGDIVAAGGTVIAQDEATSVVWGMPGAPATAGHCTAVLPLDKIPGYINDYIAKGLL